MIFGGNFESSSLASFFGRQKLGASGVEDGIITSPHTDGAQTAPVGTQTHNQVQILFSKPPGSVYWYEWTITTTMGQHTNIAQYYGIMFWCNTVRLGSLFGF